MKKYLILAAAALAAMCACTKNEVFTPDQEISFQVANYSPATKADACTKTMLESNTDFAVFAYYHTGDWAISSLADYAVYMNKVAISHKTDVDEWSAEAKYYWPKNGMLSFAGYSPASANGSFTANGIEISDFTISTTPGGYTNDNWAKANNNYDLLWSNEDASKNLDSNKKTYDHTGVPMLFHHALANLNFKVAYTEKINNEAADVNNAFIGVQINSLEIIDVVSKGTFKSDATTQWTLGTSKASPAFGTMTINAGTSAEVAAADYVDQTKDSKKKAVEYLVIPQGATKLNVKYQFITSATTGEGDNKTNVLTEEVEATIDLSTIKTTGDNPVTISNWEVEKKYTYTLIFNPISDQPLTFDPSVAAWKTVGPTDVPVK